LKVIDDKISYCLAKETSALLEDDKKTFYSEKNMKHLEKIIADIEGGHANLVEHDLIED